MELSPEEYQEMIKRNMPHSPTVKNCLWAFFSGGSICALAQLLRRTCLDRGLGEEQTGLVVSVSLIAVTALLTALGIFDELAKHTGAGTMVPITGFANAMVSPALEYKSEGLITGMAANMFKVAGPVLTYGISASVVYGLILYALG